MIAGGLILSLPFLGVAHAEECDLGVAASDYASFLPVGESLGFTAPLAFTATVVNECDSDRAFDRAEMIVSGPVKKAFPLYSGRLIVLPSSGSVSARITQPIPAFAPAEIYSIEVVLYRGPAPVASTGFQLSLHAADSMLAQIAPGGAGRFICVETAPDRPDLMFFGTDVGGLFRSTDGGETFTHASRGLKCKRIDEVEVVRDTGDDATIVYLGTTDGVYRSDDLGENWELKSAGITVIGNTYSDFAHPVMEVQAPEGDADRVWATIGEGANSAPYRTDDPYIVYRSTDRAETWEPMLDIERDDPIEKPDGFHDAMRSRVRIHPDDPDIVYVPSNRGLYATYDGGDIWYELGREEIFRSADAGSSWASCAEPGVDCEAWMPDAPCEPGIDCLPVSDYVYDLTHPTLTDLGIYSDGEADSARTYLYATIQDRGHLDRDDCTGYKSDYDLERLTGGPWRSQDGGLTWEYLFHPEDDPKQYSRVFRCNEDVSSTWSTSVYLDIEVDPFDPDHIFIDTQWQLGGVIEGRLDRDLGERWIHHTRTQHGGDPSGVQCPDFDCFEGEASQGLWGTQSFPSTEYLHGVDWSGDHPDLLLGHSRGVTRGRFDPTDPDSTYDEPGRYLFDHLDSSPHEIDPEAWRGHGLTDYSALDIMFDDSGNLALLSGGDAGVMKSTDGGGSWKELEIPSGNDTESRSCEADPEAGLYYAQWYRDGVDDEYRIAVSADEGETWEVIGGFCDTDCLHADDNGLPGSVYVDDLAIDWSSPKSAQRLLAATREGLYAYDPARASGSQWWRVGAEGCPGASRIMYDVDTFSEHPGYALVTALDASDNQRRIGNDPADSTGIYLVEMDALGITGCTRVDSDPWESSQVRAPHQVALAELEGGGLSLVASGEYNSWPRVYQTAFDFDSPTDVDWAHSIKMATGDNTFYGDPAWADSANWHFRNFADLAVAPNNRRVMVAGMGADPSGDSHAALHLYSSLDGGVTWGLAHELDYLPDKGINDSFLRFSGDGRYLYVAPAGAGVVKTVSPYWEPPAARGPNGEPLVMSGPSP